MREFFVRINYNGVQPHKATVQRLNSPLNICCHLVEQTILLKCHYVFACRKRMKQILVYVILLILARVQWTAAVPEMVNHSNWLIRDWELAIITNKTNYPISVLDYSSHDFRAFNIGLFLLKNNYYYWYFK